ncbi:hypothetical protein GPECTOR_128g538 [Gonium pectorale]|uniref:3'-5' exonuclease domain-containing protein n=1 Tax=Gonium pectorale TaxID=33097 RepID=A0A150FZI7_GONPE|nr:hypothetical protein GPECTOR_128g538 [Gonium pectorale]|eukprot:KXZ42635.1 hypothetical protein GPECTOR_128g538 [Gonium pectorale]
MNVEWRPDSPRSDAPAAALLQLSACGLSVVIRAGGAAAAVSADGGGAAGAGAGGLPTAFRTAILEDTDIELVVSGWTANDERRFEEDFGIQTFWCRISELQKVAKSVGLPKTGVKALVQAVLEPTAPMPKGKKLPPTVWDSPTLNPAQIKYGVLDAVCIEHVLRVIEARF